MQKVPVQCRHVRLSFGSTEVLKDVNLDVAPGEFFALLGPSGSGKSTLLRLIAGFNQHQHGEVLIDGADVTGKAPWERNVGMVFQSYALWPHMTVWDNVAFGLVERRVPKTELRARVGAALELVGLSAYAQRRPSQLSGGQQQRVALARTIVIEPQVLLLDEPLSNLDKTLRVQMRQELLAMQRRLGLTTIFVTHDQEEAMTTADRMAVLDKGVVQQVGAPAALYDYPANAFVAGFVGTMNLLPARVRSRSGETLSLEIPGVGALDFPGNVDAPTQGELLVSFRPRSLRVEAAESAGDERYIWMPGAIEASEFLGECTRYRIRVGDHSLAVDHPHHAGLSRFPVGTMVSLGLERSQVRLLPN
ncbi:ABC transporter ATP-binding protein [Ramlibacter sp.]|uniref:ABC transporter ATP-binding protein n=1 Tax=Ramlibacter sp. TaxID=1917967 RepID=UPI002FCA0019